MLLFLLALTDESEYSKIEYIYHSYHESMMRFAISRFRGAGRENYLIDAEDAVQGALLKLSRSARQIDLSRGKKQVQSYVFSTLANEICRVFKENSKNFENIEEFQLKDDYNFIEELEIKENYSKVVQAIAALDEIYSTTLALVYIEEIPIKEIAKMMGISPKTVYTRLERGKKLLLESVKGRIDYDC